MMQPLLEMKDTEISYLGEVAVSGINMTVHAGEIVAIVGESGSGKSTLLKAAIGLPGDEGRVSHGDIRYKGKSILTVHPEELRQMRGSGIGMIFQNTAGSLCPVRTIGSQIYESIRAHQRVTKAEVRKKASELLERFGLPDGAQILGSYPGELSGGMNQRVGIVMAMMLEPELLLADEPTSALDVTVQAEVARELKQLRDSCETGIVLVTHNIGIAERIADWILVMQAGKIVESGRAEMVIKCPRQEYTRQLIASVPRLRRGKNE